jgi:hypothetical protein
MTFRLKGRRGMEQVIGEGLESLVIRVDEGTGAITASTAADSDDPGVQLTIDQCLDASAAFARAAARSSWKGPPNA